MISAEQYSPDDNRFDLRPFLTPVSDSWWPFWKMKRSVEDWEARNMPEGNHERNDKSKYQKKHNGKQKDEGEGRENGSNHDGDRESND